MSRPIRVAGSAQPASRGGLGRNYRSSSLTPSPSWMGPVPPGHIEGPSGLCPLQFPPEFGQAFADGADLVDGGRRWLLGSTLPDGVLSDLPGYEIGVRRHHIGPKSIALGRSLEAADSFVDYGDDGRGTVALQKLADARGGDDTRPSPPSSMSRSQRPLTARRSRFGRIGPSRARRVLVEPGFLKDRLPWDTRS